MSDVLHYAISMILWVLPVYWTVNKSYP